MWAADVGRGSVFQAKEWQVLRFEQRIDCRQTNEEQQNLDMA
jgi:hypothetical protein